MKTKRVYKIFLKIGLSMLILALVLRKRDLTVVLISESKLPKIDIQMDIDGKTVFSDSLNSWVYLRKKVVIKDVGIGFHEINIKTKLGNASYQIGNFFFFNKTQVINYFDNSAESAKPYFWSWSKFGEFVAD